MTQTDTNTHGSAGAGAFVSVCVIVVERWQYLLTVSSRGGVSLYIYQYRASYETLMEITKYTL